MMDQAVYDIARRAGIAIEWRDYAERPHRVSLDTIRHILTALGLPCETADDLAQSRQQLDMRAPPSVLTATTHQPVHVPCGSDAPSRLRITYEDGAVADIAAEQAAHGFILPPIAKAGYHRINLGPNRLTLAVAPARCVTIADVTGGERVWGLAVQTYGLRSAGECGIGDMAGVVALAKAAAALKADALALSPTHALFAADPNHFSPYSPSNRIFYNPLHADAATIFGEGRVAKAQSAAAANDSSTQDEASLIDWPRGSRIKMAMFRRLFEESVAGRLQCHLQRAQHIRCRHGFAQFPGQDVAREVVEHGGQIEAAPANDLEVGKVGLPKLVGRGRRIGEAIRTDSW
jgi:4-alpha-glucanotransferase